MNGNRSWEKNELGGGGWSEDLVIVSRQYLLLYIKTNLHQTDLYSNVFLKKIFLPCHLARSRSLPWMYTGSEWPCRFVSLLSINQYPRHHVCTVFISRNMCSWPLSFVLMTVVSFFFDQLPLYSVWELWPMKREVNSGKLNFLQHHKAVLKHKATFWTAHVLNDGVFHATEKLIVENQPSIGKIRGTFGR